MSDDRLDAFKNVSRKPGLQIWTINVSLVSDSLMSYRLYSCIIPFIGVYFCRKWRWCLCRLGALATFLKATVTSSWTWDESSLSVKTDVQGAATHPHTYTLTHTHTYTYVSCSSLDKPKQGLGPDSRHSLLDREGLHGGRARQRRHLRRPAGRTPGRGSGPAQGGSG